MNEYIEVRVVNEDGEEARFSWYRDDTMTTGMAGPIPELVREAVGLISVQRDIAERLGRCRFTLQREMKATGATEYVCDGGVAVLQERGVSYDPDKLDALKELLPEDELVEAGALALEHEETKTTVVPRRWNATKLKGFAKRGAVIRGIIEGARTIEGHVVEVAAPKAKGG